MIVRPTPWPGAPHQWDLRPARPGATGTGCDPVTPLDGEPLDPRVPAVLLGLVLLVALLVVPLAGPAHAPGGSPAVAVAE